MKQYTETLVVVVAYGHEDIAVYRPAEMDQAKAFADQCPGSVVFQRLELMPKRWKSGPYKRF